MAERQRWEYLTIFMEADAAREEDYLREQWDWKGGMPPYVPQALIPHLDALGDQGWELVHMQPFFVGSKNDILVSDNSGTRTWTNKYFCVFKRPK